MKGAPLILLAEDNKADVFLVRTALEEEGLNCELRVLCDGEEALQFLDQLEHQEATHPALIILDLNMPKHSGEEVLIRVRENRRFRSLPVIVLTSSDYPKDKERVQLLGIAHYFRKPDDLQEYMKLGAVVRELVGRIGSS